MKVVNIKEARASRSYGQRSVVYIGRGSAFGNPFTYLPLDRTKALVQVNTLDNAVNFFYRWATGEKSWDDVIPAASRTRLLIAIDELQGDELLGCYCAEGARCHGQMIVRLWTERKKCKLDAARILYDLLHLPPRVDSFAAQVLGNAMLYLMMGSLYPSGYSRSPLAAWFAEP